MNSYYQRNKQPTHKSFFYIFCCNCASSLNLFINKCFVSANKFSICNIFNINLLSLSRNIGMIYLYIYIIIPVSQWLDYALQYFTDVTTVILKREYYGIWFLPWRINVDKDKEKLLRYHRFKSINLGRFHIFVRCWLGRWRLISFLQTYWAERKQVI